MYYFLFRSLVSKRSTVVLNFSSQMFTNVLMFTIFGCAYRYSFSIVAFKILCLFTKQADVSNWTCLSRLRENESTDTKFWQRLSSGNVWEAYICRCSLNDLCTCVSFTTLAASKFNAQVLQTLDIWKIF